MGCQRGPGVDFGRASVPISLRTPFSPLPPKTPFSLPQASAGVLVFVGRVGAAGAHADAAKATQVHGSSR